MRLIEVADVCEVLADMYPTDGETVISYKEIDRAYTKVQRLPTVDAASVKHGRWEYIPGDGKFRAILICSKCKKCVGEYDRYKFCPHCGACMDLEEQHDD